MGAAIGFWAGLGDEASGVDLGATSGLGFFGSGGFGTSVQVGQYQDTTFISDGSGVTQGPQVDNNKYQGNVSGVSNNGGGVIHISGLPLESGTLNVRFTNDSDVQTQNGELRIYDRVAINNDASGVTSQVAQLVQGGSGVEPTTGAAQTWSAAEDGWLALNGSGTTMTLLNSPGSGGQGPSGVGTDTRHDWYTAISASPDSIGSKTAYGLYVELEYL
jgi:hypothetical protein